MKILISYGFKKPYPPLGIFCCNAFKKLGHKVLAFNSRIENSFFKKINKLCKNTNFKINSLDHKIRVNNLFLRKISDIKPDIILDIGGRFLSSSTLKKVKKLHSVKLALWLTERAADTNDESFFDEILAYDYLFSTSEYAVREFQKKGINHVHYLPFATDISFFKKIALSAKDLNKYNCRLGFVGACEENRKKILSELIEFSPSIWGTGWDNVADKKLHNCIKSNSGLYDNNLVKFYNAAQMNLNIIQEKYRLHPSGLDLRIFDIPACQSFLITQHVEEISESFEIGKEIEVFNSVEELKSKIKFYLDNSSKRLAISKRGYEKVCKYHTFEKRIQEMLSFIL